LPGYSRKRPEGSTSWQSDVLEKGHRIDEDNTLIVLGERGIAQGVVGYVGDPGDRAKRWAAGDTLDASDMVSARRFFERAIASTGTTPRRVITDKAATYSPALAAAVSGVLHRTGRYPTNGIERHHGFLKERLRPMRGLKSIASAAIFVRGHALMRNIRRGFYRLVESAPQRLVFAWTWTRLAEAV
jgi:hypothetical protein